MKYKCGLEILDKNINGFTTSEMIVFGARPGHGNIFLLLSVVRGIYNNAENKPKIMVLTNRQQDKFPANKGDKKIFNIVYDQSQDLKSFFEQLYKVIELSKPEIIVFDINSLYFNRSKDFYRKLKKITLENDTMIIINSLLKRKADQRVYRQLQVSDLEASNVVDEIADKVVLMFRPEVYGIMDCNGRKQKGLADLVIFMNDNIYTNIFLNFDENKKIFDENLKNRGYYYL
ncbi:MAG: hypothetical protein JXR69_02695 [Candidatus Delongbacteria bacterium]|nr:hypothetical protein [Candidatus Delongbacteria bacterium]